MKHLFSKPLRLELTDRTVAFNEPGDFEFGLASRTEVPTAKVAELMRLPSDALRREARSIREVERLFVETLARSMEEPGSIGYLLRELDPKSFSQDHGWRDIMGALTRQRREFDEFKKIALVKYVQYLASRQDVLQSIYAQRQREDVPEVESDGGASPALRQTLLFNVSDPESDAAADASAEVPPKLERLPRGETMTIPLRSGDELSLVLSRHRFTLVRGERTYFADENGGDFELSPGHNVIGRQPGNDVVVDPAYRDVSRRHLIVDLADDDAVRLTDLSSHGTYLRAGVLTDDVLD